MADLSLKRWARYEPSIPGNAALPAAERFFLEVQGGLSTLEVRAFFTQFLEATTHEARAELLAKVCRMGSVPLKLDGAEVTGLDGYLAAIWGERGQMLLTEALEMVTKANTYDGARELFSGRPSGGSASTADASTAKVVSRTAAP